MAVGGLFVVGTDTDVGKTHVASRIVRQLAAAGFVVGVYKPVASGVDPGRPDAGDAGRLASATGRRLDLGRVCPQAFAAACAPEHSAHAEGRAVDERLLRDGITYWLDTSEIVVVEGAGGLCSPVGPATLVLDLAREFALPLVVVDDARLGAVGRTLVTVRAARAAGLSIAAVVLSWTRPPSGTADDVAGPRRIVRDAVRDLAARLPDLPISVLDHAAERFEPAVDWMALAQR